MPKVRPMRTLIRPATLPRLLPALALAAICLLAPFKSSHAGDGNPFDTLLGSWRGNGQIALTDGKTERLKCNAYYTGGGSQLGMAIRCQSESSNVEIRSKLSQSGGRISGTWEERTYNAQGNASGQASTGKISLSISRRRKRDHAGIVFVLAPKCCDLDARDRSQERDHRPVP